MSKQLDSIINRVPRATPGQAPAPLTVVPQPTAAAEAAPEAARPAAAASKPKRGEGKAARPAPTTEAGVKPTESEVPIAAVVPVSLRKAIMLRAVEQDLTLRGIILQGLQAIGFDISDDMIRDRRTK